MSDEAVVQFAEAEWRKHVEWACGDKDAARLIQVLGRASQLADAFLDNDVEDIGTTTESRSGAMTELLLLLLNLDRNPFWAQHSASLRPVAVVALLSWDATNQWAESPDEKTRMYAWAWREALDQTIVAVALLKGGLEWSRKVAQDVHAFYHARASEPFSEWDRKREGKWPTPAVA